MFDNIVYNIYNFLVNIFNEIFNSFNPLSANPTKWLNTPKQFVGSTVDVWQTWRLQYIQFFG